MEKINLQQKFTLFSDYWGSPYFYAKNSGSRKSVVSATLSQFNQVVAG
jgi:hypothetical protein